MARYKLACGSWGFAVLQPYAANPYPLEAVCKRLAELKYDGVELWGGRPHAFPSDFPTKKDRRDLLSMIRGYGLEIPCLAADISGWMSPLLLLASPWESIRKMHERVFDADLEFCCDLEIGSMRVDTVMPPSGVSGVDYETTWKRIVSAFRRYAAKAEDRDVVLLWEFEPHFIVNKPTEILKLVKEVDSPNFRILVDTCHAQTCGLGLNQVPPLDIIKAEPHMIAATFIRMFKGYIGGVHLIDSDNTLRKELPTSTHVSFGKGVIDFHEVMKALKEVGYTQGWLTLDVEMDVWTEAGPCREFVEKLIAQHIL